MRRRHEVTITVAGKKIGGWTEYSIECSMLAPADAFSLTRPVSREVVNLCETDAPVSVQIDGTTVLNGRIGAVRGGATDGTMVVSGRDLSGRLVQESAPGVQYAGLKLVELVKRLASPWFTNVVLSDARNRAVRRGKGYHAPAPTEPLVLDAVTAGGRIEPGQMKWQVIEELVTQAGYLCWSSADGKELVIGKPNYSQAIQWQFVVAEGRSTVLDLTTEDNVEDGYSRILVVGASRGTDADYGTGPSERAGEWLDFPGPEGVGGDFQAPKRLVLGQQKLRSSAEGKQLAEREARRRNRNRRMVTVEAPGHGQIVRGATPTIFAPNTMAHVVWEAWGLDGAYLVTGCKFASKRDDERTSLQLVPKGTELSL